jgi:hypothetical protein
MYGEVEPKRLSRKASLTARRTGSMAKDPSKQNASFDAVAGDLRRKSEEAMQSFGRAALETGKGPMSTLAGVALLGFAAGVAASLSRRAATEASIEATGDWLEALNAEHVHIARLFEQILALGVTEGAKRQKLFKKLDKVLARHAFAEESVIYPTLVEAELADAARALAGDHFDVRAKLHALEALDRASPDWTERLRDLHEGFSAHARKEETDVYPALRKHLSPQQNEALTTELARRAARLA